MECIYCHQKSVICKGFYKNIQRYQCKSCKKYFQETYSYKRNEINTFQIVSLSNEGMGISSIARIIKTSKTTVQRHILKAAKQLKIIRKIEINQEYEIDEMCTYIGKRTPDSYIYITYAIDRNSKQVVDFTVGKRTTEVISKVVQTILNCLPKKIYTDRLNIYPSLIPKPIHSRTFGITNDVVQTI